MARDLKVTKRKDLTYAYILDESPKGYVQFFYPLWKHDCSKVNTDWGSTKYLYFPIFGKKKLKKGKGYMVCAFSGLKDFKVTKKHLIVRRNDGKREPLKIKLKDIIHMSEDELDEKYFIKR